MGWFVPVALTLLLGCWLARAEVPRFLDSSPASAVESGPHHRVWERTDRYITSYGKVYERPVRYTELGTGMNWWHDGQWKPAQARFAIVDGSAAALEGPHQAIVAANLNSRGSIEYWAPGGQKFQSHILGLAFHDSASQQTVLFAQPKDCLGALALPNVVYFQDAFDSILADVKITYKKDGMSQDVVLLSEPELPEGMDPLTTRIEVWTEFIASPEPVLRAKVLRADLPGWPGLTDHLLDFGGAMIGDGFAFELGSEDLFEHASVPTVKSWIHSENRVFLVEQVEYISIAPYLAQLPQAAVGPKREPQLQLARTFPPPPSGPRLSWKDNRMARLEPKRKGLLIDYQSVGGSLTNYTFKSDLTYCVTNTLQLYGTTVIEGGSVIKFGNSALQFVLNGPVDCRTSPWHPAVWTATDDDTVGALISGSSGSPSGNYALYAFACKDTSQSYLLHDLRFRHVSYAINVYGSVDVRLSHAQIGHVGKAVGLLGSSIVSLRNVLVHDSDYGFFQSANGNSVEHATFHRISKLAHNTNAPVHLTNSLLIAVTNNYAYSGQNVGISSSDSGVFQTAGAGSRYLASSYRDSGTTNIDAGLLQDLRTRTTDPPVILTNLIASDLTLGRQAGRDESHPDLGYHYDPLDWLAQSVTLSNSTVLVTNAATVGIDLNGTNYGFKLSHGAVLASGGFAHDLNRFVRIHAVQENPASAGAYFPMFCDVDSSSDPPEASFALTDFPLLAYSFLWNEDDGYATTTPWRHRDCRFRGGYLWSSQGITNAVASFTNNLFERFVFLLGPTAPTSNQFMNNLFWNGNLTVYEGNFKDNLFVDTYIISGTITNDYNAYVTNATRLSPNGPNDRILTNTPGFLSGPLGGYYYPTNDGMPQWP